LDVNEIKELLRAVAESDVTEFEFEREGARLRLRRGRVAAELALGQAASPAPPAIAGVEPAAAPSVAAAGLPSEAQAHPEVPAVARPEDDGLAFVKSPIVGTFYRAPDPNAPPFVSVGDRVRAGQVLCIVEAMKLMNEIESEIGGEIVQVLAENGQPVQFGDELFVIRPDR
jgi:acetyl-CoA carboxylase biotin carboxyl carrier protein